MFWDFPNLVLGHCVWFCSLQVRMGERVWPWGPPWRNVYCGAGDDLHLRPHQARDNELPVNWWEILAPGRLLGSLITD